MMVTLAGSPPKEAMLSCTQRRALLWSRKPWLPGTSSVPRLRKPNGPSLGFFKTKLNMKL